MTGYLVNHQKKNKIFKKRVRELEHAIKNDFKPAQIEKAAEKVRLAKLATLKMKFSRDSVLPASRFDIESENSHWLHLSTQEIIDSFAKSSHRRSSDGKARGYLASSH